MKNETKQLLKINQGRNVIITDERTEGTRQTSQIVHLQAFMQGAPEHINEAHIMRAVLWHTAPDLLEMLELAYDELLSYGADKKTPVSIALIADTIKRAKTLPMPMKEALLGINVPIGATAPQQKIYRINEPVNYNNTADPRDKTTTRAPAYVEPAPKSPTKTADEVEQDTALSEMRARLGLG